MGQRAASVCLVPPERARGADSPLGKPEETRMSPLFETSRHALRRYLCQISTRSLQLVAHLVGRTTNTGQLQCRPTRRGAIRSRRSGASSTPRSCTSTAGRTSGRHSKPPCRPGSIRGASHPPRSCALVAYSVRSKWYMVINRRQLRQRIGNHPGNTIGNPAR